MGVDTGKGGGGTRLDPGKGGGAGIEVFSVP